MATALLAWATQSVLQKQPTPASCSAASASGAMRAWVINKSVAATGTSDPLLQARLTGEQKQCERIAQGLAQRTFVLPWLTEPPVGVEALGGLVTADGLLSH